MFNYYFFNFALDKWCVKQYKKYNLVLPPANCDPRQSPRLPMLRPGPDQLLLTLFFLFLNAKKGRV